MTYKEAVDFMNDPRTTGYVPVDAPDEFGAPDENQMWQRDQMRLKLNAARSALIYFAFVETPFSSFYDNSPDQLVYPQGFYSFYGQPTQPRNNEVWAPDPEYPQGACCYIDNIKIWVSPITLGEGLRWRWYGPDTGSIGGGAFPTVWEAVEAAEEYARSKSKVVKKERLAEVQATIESNLTAVGVRRFGPRKDDDETR